MEKNESPPVIEIRKYSNRRLYDTSVSAYVTLSDVAQMIRERKEICVVDAKTGEDLTRAVMLQIICESKPEQEALPIGFLRQVIQASSKSVRSSIQEFLTGGLHAHKEVQNQMAHWMKLGMMVNPLASPLITAWEHLAGNPKEATDSEFGLEQLPAVQISDEKEQSSSISTNNEEKTTTKELNEAEEAEEPKERKQDIQDIQAQLAALQKQINEL